MLRDDAFSFWAPEASFGGRHIQCHFLPSLSMLCYFVEFDACHPPIIGVMKVRVGIVVVLGSLVLPLRHDNYLLDNFQVLTEAVRVSQQVAAFVPSLSFD